MHISGQFITWIVVFAVIEVILKSIALWQSARRDEIAWFVALVVINSGGLLPIIYFLTHLSADEPKEPVKK